MAAGQAVLDAARDGRARDALSALAEFRLLCAHRRGPYGVSHWTSRQEAWLAERIDDLDLHQRDYVGRPLLVLENDYELGLYSAPSVPRSLRPGGAEAAGRITAHRFWTCTVRQTADDWGSLVEDG